MYKNLSPVIHFLFDKTSGNNAFLFTLYNGDCEEILDDLTLRLNKQFDNVKINNNFINEYITKKGIGNGYLYLKCSHLTEHCIKQLLFGCQNERNTVIYAYFGSYFCLLIFFLVLVKTTKN